MEALSIGVIIAIPSQTRPPRNYVFTINCFHIHQIHQVRDKEVSFIVLFILHNKMELSSSFLEPHIRQACPKEQTDNTSSSYLLGFRLALNHCVCLSLAISKRVSYLK